MRRRALSLVLAVATAGCNLGKPTTPRSPRPVAQASTPVAVAAAGTRVIPQVGEPTTLTGKVKIISDNGSGIISDNGGAIISDNGSGIISNNGSGLISNNGGSLTSKAKRHVLAAPRELSLADAAIQVQDASGKTLVDAAGKPLTATSDGQGGYTFKAVLPHESLVLRIPLRFGGELSAMVAQAAPGARALPIDTGSTLGAAYVLAKYVKGDQKVFDKLPAEEAQGLAEAANVARDLLDKRPKYQPDALVALADQLRTKAPALDRKLEDIKVLLLGQANLGNGRRATQVPLVDVHGLVALADGSLLIAERFSGRVRMVSPAGVITTYVDGLNGQIRTNLRRVSYLAPGPAGSLYFTSESNPRVVRLDPDGTQTIVAGNGTASHDGIAAKAVDSPMVPNCVAVGPDGTVYVGENQGSNGTAGTPRVLAIAPDGTIKAFPLPAGVPDGNVTSVQAAADGTLYVLYRPDDPPGFLYRVRPSKAMELVAGDLFTKDDGDLALAPDGTLYMSERGRQVVVTVGPDGKRTPIAGAGTPEGPADLLGPSKLTLGPDGTLYVVDSASNRVWARLPAGGWAVVAGAGPAALTSADQVAVNVPGGAAFDPQGRLVFTDSGSNSVRRFDFKNVETIAGSVEGKGGDGGPASQAQLAQPTDLALRDGKIWINDSGNHRIRMIDASGTISTVVGGPDSDDHTLDPAPVAPAAFSVRKSLSLAVSATGVIVFANVDQKYVFALLPDGLVHRIMGAPGAPAPAAGGSDPTACSLQVPTGMVFDQEGNLYIADGVGCQVFKLTGIGTPKARIAPVVGVPIGTALARLGDGHYPDEEGHPAIDATLIGPAGIGMDTAGNLYVGETGTQGVGAFAPKNAGPYFALLDTLPSLPGRVRKVAKDGTITTIAGPGGKFFNDPLTDEPLGLPSGLAVSPDGRFAIVDGASNLIRFLPAGSY